MDKILVNMVQLGTKKRKEIKKNKNNSTRGAVLTLGNDPDKIFEERCLLGNCKIIIIRMTIIRIIIIMIIIINNNR